VVRIALTGTYGVKTWANVFHAIVDDTGPVGSSDLAGIAGATSTAWSTHLSPSLSNAIALTQVAATDLTSDTGLTELDTSVHTGGQAGNASPPQVALLLSWKIARRYRGGHPRTYLPGVIEADVDNYGAVIAARQTALNTGATNFRLAINSVVVAGGTPRMAVVHYYRNGVIQATPTVDEVLSGRCSPLVATQRRRLRG
jgi:hypothetical protein